MRRILTTALLGLALALPLVAQTKPAVTRAASKAVAAPKQSTPALAAGDDWEEF